ncbi:MAG: DUF3187 family protein [Gammaproteobacteria bacterium]|nr:DUF3187 family protein [Gammaproteobacteria bacterium]
MKKIINAHIAGLIITTFVFSQSIAAEQVAPLLTRDQNPLVSIHGFPLPVAGRILDENQSRFISSINISNTINDQQTANESLFLDIESYQLNLLYDVSLSKNWMLRFELPVTGHSGGFLDAWIENYHDIMHLPEDIRPEFPRDQLIINYQNNGNQILDFQQAHTSLGDISIQAGYQLSATEDYALSYWTSIKLPTGDSRKLSGSDGSDLALWIAADFSTGDSSWFYGNLGYLFMQDSELLQEQHKNTAVFGNLGMQFHPWRPILLKVQLDAHSAVYDSGLDLLDDVIQLSFGGTILFDNNSSLDIAVAEDIQSGYSPDVNFNISWHSRY